MDETLEAELDAARAAARRRRTLRHVLICLEDREDPVVVHTAAGRSASGTIIAVGIDHIELQTGGCRSYVALDHVVAVDLPC
jgi:hypothetical protein